MSFYTPFNNRLRGSDEAFLEDSPILSTPKKLSHLQFYVPNKIIRHDLKVPRSAHLNSISSRNICKDWRSDVPSVTTTLCKLCKTMLIARKWCVIKTDIYLQRSTGVKEHYISYIINWIRCYSYIYFNRSK